VHASAVSADNGNQAQFNHPEFGGMGQWSMGGMIMIGDMFNNYLKGRVDSLCQELSSLIQGQPLFQMPAQSQSQSKAVAGTARREAATSSRATATATPARAFSCPMQHRAIGGPPISACPVRPAVKTICAMPIFSRGAAAGRRHQRSGCRFTISGQHQIGGFSQHQSGDQSITFTSQFGLGARGRPAAGHPCE
jgi:hypothetical protein